MANWADRGDLGGVAVVLAELAWQRKWKKPLPAGKKGWLRFVESVRFEFERDGVKEARQELQRLLGWVAENVTLTAG